MSDFTPKTRLQKILCGVETVAKTRLEKSAKQAVDNASGESGSDFAINALAEINGTDVTLSNINKNSAEVAAAVAAKKPVKLNLEINAGLEYPVYASVPLTQAVGTEYSFTGVVSFDKDGTNIAEITLEAASGGIWNVNGKFVTIPAT